MTRKVICLECGRRREPYRPVVRAAVSGEVRCVCKACWRDLDYELFFTERLSIEDRAALTAALAGR